MAQKNMTPISSSYRLIKQVLFILLFAGAQLAMANDAAIDDSLLAAEKYYQAENYAAAVAAYESVTKQGYSSESLFYNLGNAYYKSGDFVRAILNYERCLKINPRHEEAEFNLNIAKLQQADKINVIPEFFMLEWYRDFISFLSPNTWGVMNTVLFLILLGLVYIYFNTRSMQFKKLSFVSGIFVLCFFIATLVFASHSREYRENHDTAIILTPSLTVKSTPSDSGQNLFVIHEGLKVTISDEYSGWYKIKIADGSEGWVLISDLEVI